jgi:hypothetical protein
MTTSAQKEYFTKAADALRLVAKTPLYQGRWIADHAWVSLIMTHYSNDKDFVKWLGSNAKNLNSAVGNVTVLCNAMDNINMPNQFGLFRQKHSRRVDGKPTCITAYYACPPEDVPAFDEEDGAVWWENVALRVNPDRRHIELDASTVFAKPQQAAAANAESLSPPRLARKRNPSVSGTPLSVRSSVTCTSATTNALTPRHGKKKIKRRVVTPKPTRDTPK